jgi:hypothetical protein
MKKVFEYLLEHCDKDESVVRSQESELWFSFSHFDIIFEYSSNEGEYDDNDDYDYDAYYSISEFNFSTVKYDNLLNIYLQSSQPLCEEDGLLPIQESLQKNYSYLMWQIAKDIQYKYLDSISKYDVKIFCLNDCCSGFGCPDPWMYGFQIVINREFWTNLSFFRHLINIDLKEYDYTVPEFYNKDIKIKSSFDIEILNSNTKIRRLGYFKILLKMMREQTKVPSSKINFRFEKYCKDYNHYLDSYKNQKGNIIETKTGNSASPYIEMAEVLGLIHKSGDGYDIGKYGRIYNIISNKLLEKKEENPFILSTFDIVFFLEILLQLDYWFLFAILEQAEITQSISYKKLKTEFKEILLVQIEKIIESAKEKKINSAKILQLKMIQRRIKDWKKPEVYMEHVLMPRLNWLYDLNLISLEKDLSFTLTESGKKLVYHLFLWKDLEMHRIVSPTPYVNNYYLKMMNEVLGLNKPYRTSTLLERFFSYVDESFSLFKTLAPNRVTFSLMANYTKYILFLEDRGIIDSDDIKRLFESNSKNVEGYIFRYQEHYKDGYLQKKNL